jgi:hypothetical protein
MYLVGNRGRLQNGFVCYNIKPLSPKKSFMEKLKKHAKKTQAVPQRSPEMPTPPLFSGISRFMNTIVSSKAINLNTMTKK